MNRPALGCVVTFWIVIAIIVWISQSAASVLLLAMGIVVGLLLTAFIYGIGTALFDDEA